MTMCSGKSALSDLHCWPVSGSEGGVQETLRNTRQICLYRQFSLAYRKGPSLVWEWRDWIEVGGGTLCVVVAWPSYRDRACSCSSGLRLKHHIVELPGRAAWGTGSSAISSDCLMGKCNENFKGCGDWVMGSDYAVLCRDDLHCELGVVRPAGGAGVCPPWLSSGVISCRTLSGKDAGHTRAPDSLCTCTRNGVGLRWFCVQSRVRSDRTCLHP